MSLANLIRKRETGKPANASPAKAANDGRANGEPLAGLAALAFANPAEPKTAKPAIVGAGGTVRTPADDRMGKVIDKLHGDPGLRYAMEAHDGIEPEAVILSLAIRDKAACELRIPKSRYDAFALLELIERHTTIAILQ